ncbi:ATP synthase F1 subunit delta [uncultured Nitrospira sp.]|uniref:ATP synthase F1 subunit delta n=1 Tax=uncultured Nitrospira sp. TaxID=157176 RepID=UPI003140794B
MNKSTIGRRYASALFQLLDQSGIESARSALSALQQGLEEIPALKHVLASPVFNFEEKQAVLTELSQRMEAPSVMRDFLTQLLKKNRAMLLPEISEAFAELADQQQGVQQVWVVSATPLPSAEKEQIKQDLSQTLHHGVEVAFEIDPHLIAGLRIKIGSRVFDNTVLGRLTGMHDQLTKG